MSFVREDIAIPHLVFYWMTFISSMVWQTTLGFCLMLYDLPKGHLIIMDRLAALKLSLRAMKKSIPYFIKFKFKRLRFQWWKKIYKHSLLAIWPIFDSSQYQTLSRLKYNFIKYLSVTIRGKFWAEKKYGHVCVFWEIQSEYFKLLVLWLQFW